MSAVIKCSRCGKEGHLAAACAKPFFRQHCSYCQRGGHDISTCGHKRRAEWEERQKARLEQEVERARAWEDRQTARVEQDLQRARVKLTLQEQRNASRANRAAAIALVAQQRNERKMVFEQREIAEKACLLRAQAEKESWESGSEKRKVLTAAMAIRRMVADWKAMQASPLPGIAAHPLEDDMQTWHFNLRGAQGELEGLVLHGVIRFPPTYPCDPPQLRLCTSAPHPNVFEEAEGFGVCMDLLESGSAKPYCGWSSSYCASSIFLQLQSTLFDERACIYDRLTLQQALSAAEQLQCSCGHCFDSPKPAFSTEDDFHAIKGKLVRRPIVKAIASLKVPDMKVRSSVDDDNLCEASTCGSEASLQVPLAETLSAEWNINVCKPASRGCSPSFDIIGDGDMVESYFKAKGGVKSKRVDVGTCQSLTAATVSIRFRDGVKQSVPREWVQRILGRPSRTSANTTQLALECDAAAQCLRSVIPRAAKFTVAISQIPFPVLIEVLQLVSAEDASSLCLCARSFTSLGDDGRLWKQYFSKRYPRSELSAESMADWKHCFLLEVHGIESDLTCFHTKVSFRDTVLGLPLDYSVNPRTHRIDYISSSLDYLSAEAYDSGVRLTQWNEQFKDFLPLYLSAEHFRRARERFEEAMVRLSPHWPATSFHPDMILEVLPKLMNTMVVLLCDKGLDASDRAIDGYFLVWRLLLACLDVYDLHGKVRDRLARFVETDEQRSKTYVPSLGDFVPLLAVCREKEYCWNAIAKPLLEESFARSVLWVCKANPTFALQKNNILGEGANAQRLEQTLDAVKISQRLYMFHVLFLELVEQNSADLFFGRPPKHVRAACKKGFQSILEVASWDGFFAACSQPCPEPAELTDRLKHAVWVSLKKGYHSERTDFTKVHASGVSHILRKGESYRVSSTVSNVRLVLGSDSSCILCGACLVYNDLICTEIAHYGSQHACGGAISHSGDTVVDGKSKHTIDVDLACLPASVTRLFFTLCACGCNDLSGFQNPAIDMNDENGVPLCTYSLDTAGNAPTVVMAVVARADEGWKVVALGVHSAVRCCGNYSRVKRDIATINID